jgi:hypothetical protein
MKRLLLFMVFFTLVVFCYSQNNNKVWDYPLKPGTDAWASLNSSQEMIDTCQIPLKIIQELSTEVLADICLNYPLLGDMLFANNFQEGFEELCKKFNGFQELFKRKDAGFELFNIYKRFDLTTFYKKNGGKSRNALYDMCIEIVMSQPIFFR